MREIDIIERGLCEQITKVELLAELDITPELAEQLGSAIVELVSQYNHAEATRYLERFYPASLVVFLVAQGIYGYRDGDYWSGVARVVGIDQNIVQRWGRIFEDVLQKWAKPRFPTLGGRRYVDHILVHGGIPDYCLPDFFLHMLEPAVTRPELVYLDTNELITEWLHTTAGRYMTDKPVLRFLEHGGTIANDFVARCLDMARQYLEFGSVPTAEEVGLPARVVDKYRQWVAQRNIDKSARTSQLRLVRPQIWFDPYGDGVLLDLPVQTLPIGNDSPDCSWHVTINGRTTRYPVHAWKRSGEWETEPDRIPLNEIAESYTIVFEDGRELQRQWRFIGIREVPLLAFDPDEGQLIEWHGVLPNRELWLVYPSKLPLTVHSGELRETAADLPDVWSTYHAERWNLEHVTLLKLGDKDIYVEPDIAVLRPRLDGGHPFSDVLSRGQSILYIGDPPDIVVPLPSRSDLSAEINRWHISIREESGRVLCSMRLSQLAHALTFEDGTLRLSLRSAGLLTNGFGSYVIAMRGPLGRDATFRIALVPSLQISGHEMVRLPNEKGQYIPVELFIETAPDIHITCDTSNVQLIPLQAGVVALSIPSDYTQITLYLVKDDTSISISIPLPILVWSLNGTEVKSHESNQLLVRPAAWLDQVHSPRLLVSIVPHSYTPRKFGAYLYVYHNRDAELQTLRARGGAKKRWMQFYLAEAADSIRSSPDSSALFELVIEQLDGYEKPIELSVLRISKTLNVGQVICEGMYRGEQCFLRLRWRGVQQLRSRCLLLWSLWRPWEAPVTLSIDDSAEYEQHWTIPLADLPPGAYRAEMTVNDPWSSREPLRPYYRGSGISDIVLGRHADHVRYLYRRPKTLFGELERLLVVEHEAQILEHLNRLPPIHTTEDMVGILSTFLTLYERADTAERLALNQWQPLARFQQICTAAPVLLLTALTHYCVRLDQYGLTLLEDALQFIIPPLTSLFFRGLRERRLSIREVQRALNDFSEQTRETIIAALDVAGIQIHEPEIQDTKELVPTLSSLTEIYDVIPEVLITDSLRQYFHDISQFPLLSVEQERELAARIADGLAAAEEKEKMFAAKHTMDLIHMRTLNRRIEAGMIAREELANANLRLVVSIAKKYLYRQMPLQDLIQEGNIGLLRAIDKFDVSRGYKFSTYATWWIRQAITRGLADKQRVIRLPVHLIESINRLQRAHSRMTLVLGHPPSEEELAQELSLAVEKVRHYLTLAEGVASLNAPVGDDGSTLGDFIEAPDELSIFDTVSQQMLEEQINLMLDRLTERERCVLVLRFGIEDGRERTLEEVGKLFGVTRERIRQIEVKALKKLRHPRLAQQLQDYYI